MQIIQNRLDTHAKRAPEKEKKNTKKNSDIKKIENINTLSETLNTLKFQ